MIPNVCVVVPGGTLRLKVNIEPGWVLIRDSVKSKKQAHALDPKALFIILGGCC